MKVSFYTLGCKVNQYETEALKEQFAAHGYEIANSFSEDNHDDDAESDEVDSADIYVINTCTVTNLADRKSRQFIRRAKSENPNAIIAVTGCYAQVEPEAVAEIPGVNLIVGTNEKNSLVSHIEKYIDEISDDGRRVVKDQDEESTEAKGPDIHIKPYEELNWYESGGIISSMDSRTRAYIKIQEGCNRFCTYCIIPYARGQVRSRPEEEILREVRGLIGSGYKEIVLTGINTALYGADNPDSAFGLAKLLKKIDDISGDFRVRLSSLEPTVVSKNDVESILDSRRLCHHLHLSIQSGSNKILKSMNRNYNRDGYLEIVNMLRERDPLFGITTDIIVGFPGETEEDFDDSIDIITKSKFARVHGFRYSPRKGTRAAGFPNQVGGSEKKNRIERLTRVAEEAADEFNTAMIGTPTIVLMEEIVEIDGRKYLTGYSDNYVKIYLPAEECMDPNMLLNDLVEIVPQELYNSGLRAALSENRK